MATFYKEVTVPAAYGVGDDVGFVPLAYKLSLQSNGPVEYSFDQGATVAGVLGPAATRPMVIEHQGGSSRISFKGGAGAWKVDVWAWD